MNTELDVVIAGIIGFVIGAILVAIINSSSKGKQSEETSKLQAEFDAYREQVNAHFAKTADAVDGLTKSYQQVFDHLSDGAQNLMDKKALQAQLEKRQGKAVTLAYLVDQEEIAEKDAVKKTVSEIKHSSIVSGADVAKDKIAVTPAEKAKAESVKPQVEEVAVKDVEKAIKSGDVKPVDAKSTSHSGKPDSIAVKAEPVKVDNTAAKSNVHKAAEKAGLKPADSIVKSNEHETAIESVKKHIKDDKGSKA